MNKIKNFLKGIAIGGTMMVPGVSGGTMALILGIYDEIIHSLSSFFKNIKKNITFLGILGIGGLIGLVTVGLLVDKAITHLKFPTMFLFLGIVIGGLPVLFKEAKRGEKKKTDWVFFLIGVAFIAGLMFLDAKVNGSLVNLDKVTSALYIYLFIAGIVISVALILPGISTSFLLLVLGLFEPTMKAIKTVDLNFLIPLILGVLAGIVLTTKLLERLMDKKPRPTYLMIIGFVVASMIEVIPGVPKGMDIVLSPLALIGGYFLIKYVSEKYAD